MTLLFIALGAAVGAPARYLTDRFVRSRHDTRFPFGTLTVNVLASLGLGVVTGAGGQLDPRLMALLATGLCGALSTFSTFGFETLRLAQERSRQLAAVNVAGSVLLGLGAAALGWWLGQSLV